MSAHKLTADHAKVMAREALKQLAADQKRLAAKKAKKTS